ncbi:MAG: pyruvate kinase [Planctomycetota bacterium]|nr:pyruvate kinase [Planctomycetota bacterium]
MTTREPPPLTKILATLGPATDDPKVLLRLIEHGAGLFRLNFSHGKVEEHAARLRAVRDAARQTGTPLAVLGDLSGPKIRVGVVPPADDNIGIRLEIGMDVLVSAGPGESRPPSPETGGMPHLVCNYPRIAAEVDPGQRVLINDGAIRMLAVVSDGQHVLCRVTQGGMVISGKGLNLPDSELSIPATTERDLAMAQWGLENGLDYLALSFVRRAAEVRAINECLHRACALPGTPSRSIPVIAKIETPQAVRNIDDILAEADGIMVARGDLGVEMEIAKVPVIQKMLMRRAHEFGKPCIVATQMLESMIENASPTRAEVSDVANAIYDGADAVMLSGETAVGKHPMLAVEMMRRVALSTEEVLREQRREPRPPSRPRESRERVPALAHGLWHMAQDVGAVLAVVWSQDGEAARYLSRNGFQMPILAFSSDPAAVRRMNLFYGVFPALVTEVPQHRSDFAKLADHYILDNELAKPGQPIVLLGGKPIDDPGATNTAAIRFVGEMSGPRR